MTDSTPVHISMAPDSKRHLCGVKSDQLPYVGAHAVQMHVDGWSMPVCPECWWAFGGAEPVPAAVPDAFAQASLFDEAAR